MGWSVWHLDVFYRIPALVRQHGRLWQVPSCRVLLRIPFNIQGTVIDCAVF